MKSESVAARRRERRHRTTPSERRRWVAAWESSNQTQEEFARSRGLKVASLRNWIRWETRSASPSSGKVELRELKLDEVIGAELFTASVKWDVEIRLPGGIAVAVGCQTPAERVRQIVEALRC